ncbi:hypothetical protein CapIbe_013434 [Capra ibex]
MTFLLKAGCVLGDGMGGHCPCTSLWSAFHSVVIHWLASGCIQKELYHPERILLRDCRQKSRALSTLKCQVLVVTRLF